MIPGARHLIQKYGSPLGVAEALLEDKLITEEYEFIEELLTSTVRWAAEVRYAEKQLAVHRWANHAPTFQIQPLYPPYGTICENPK